jgi:hypothetical protein
MQYMLLIYYDPQSFALMSEDDRREIGIRYFAFSEELRGSGNMLSGDALHRSKPRPPFACGTARR